MDLNDIFLLFLQQEDAHAKNGLVDFMQATPHARERVQAFLTAKLTETDDFSTLEGIDVMAHFSDLSLVSTDDDGPLDDFQLSVVGLENTGTYNRCGRLALNQRYSSDRFSFYNQRSGQREEIPFSQAAAKIVVRL